MENIDGALGFKATLEIDDFNVSAQAMERRIKDFSNTAIEEVAGVDDAFSQMAQKAGQYISYYLVGQGMTSLVNSIVQTRGQFQQLEIAFGTMLGSEEKAAQLMQQMVDTAAKTPFDLMGVAEGAKQLMAYGVSADKVNDTLVRLGNIASGLSIPLNDIVYLYGTTMVQGRLYAQDVRQFTGRGIPLVKELAEKYHKTTDEINAMVSAGKVGFKDVEEVLNKMTNAGGQFYNLMEKQSSSLTGQISNLEDAWDSVLNEWGKSNEDIFAGAISGATYLVEHMDDVVRILKAVAIGYGSVKAAIILHNVATKNATGIAVLDNTARSAKLALMKAEMALTGKATAQTEAMAMANNAYFKSLEATLTAEERSNAVKSLRIQTIAGLLTIQQQEYLSNMGLSTSSVGYEAAAMGVLSAEQRLALSKVDLTEKSALYRAAIVQEVQVKQASKAATLDNEIAERKANVERLTQLKAEALQLEENQRLKLISARQGVATARMELTMARQSGDAKRINNALLGVEAAEHRASGEAVRYNMMQSSTLARTKALEAAQTRLAMTETTKSTGTSVADAAAKEAQAASTNTLSTATGRLSKSLKSLWLTMAANPLGAILTLVGLVASAFTMFGSDTEENKSTMDEFGESTKKVMDKLDLYFAILQKSEKDSKVYKDTLEKINAICQEYNVTLLDENATLREQEAAYLKVKAAVQATTAEKIKAKRIEEESEKYNTNVDNTFNRFNDTLGNLKYNTGKTRTIETDQGTLTQSVLAEASNIRNMDSTVRDMIRSIIEDGVKELSKLSGEEYTKKYNEIVSQIMIGTQRGTKATTEEMEAFKRVLLPVIDEVVSKFNKLNEAIKRADESVGGFTEPKKVSVETDYAKMSLAELDTELNNTQKAIDTINAKKIKLETDNKELDELLEKLKAIKGEQSKQTANLNTEQGISARIKQLKDEREQTEIDSKRYKELDKEIAKLERRLPKHTNARTDANNAEKASEALKQKQIEADRKLEEARIETLEDGYGKRKAKLDLQHKSELERIDKEEKELEKARKKAGESGLTDKDKANYQQRRDYENQSYEKAQTKLFDGEIEYKRKQYELYFRWVANMGEEVANTKFSSLLKSGKSFKDYLEKEIAALNQKKGQSDLTEAETNHLIALNIQYDEVTGAKTALEAFKQTVSDNIAKCSTLAEKIEAVAKAQKQLSDGTTGIVDQDEKTAAAVELAKQQADYEKELHDSVLNDYKTYEEQRASITQQYALLRSEAEKMGDEKRVEKIKKAEQEALSALNTSFLQQTDSWKNLFSDLDTLSVAEIEKLVKDIEAQLNSGQLVLSPVDYKAVIESLEKAKEEILKKNPFQALGSYFNDYLEAQKKLQAAKLALANGSGSEDDVKAAEREVKTSAAGITSAITEITDFSTSCAASLQSMFDSLGMEGAAEGIGTAIELVGQLGNAAASVGKFMSGDVLGGITGMIGAVTSVVGIFAKLHDAKYEKRIQSLQKQIDALERSYDRLERAFNTTYWVFTDEQRAGYEANLKLINDQIEALERQRQQAARLWDFARYAQLTTEIKKLQDELGRTKENGDMLSIYQAEKESLRHQQELIREQIQAEKSKKKSDDGKVTQYNEAIESIEQKIEDLDRQMMETFAGTDAKSAIDQFADAIVEAFSSGEDAAKAMGETTKAILKNAVVEALKRQFLAKAINDAVEYLGTAMSDGWLSDEERKNFETMVNQGGDMFRNALEGIGSWIKDLDDTTTDPLQGAVASMSEETAGVIAGRLNAFIINQADQTSVLREQLLQQSEIARNTAQTAQLLQSVEATLRRIETKDNSYLSQGIS